MPTLTYPNTFVNNTIAEADEVNANFNAISTFANRAFSAPEGFLFNGKIVPSVASNNLTIAIKTLAGTNPSSTDPVYCRINGVVRTISSALSVTKNAGTNWCNAGSSELATKEIDYFVYLGYNATDGVVIGFSRIPYGSQYSEFSTTSTNEKYCAISTITNASSTDYYNVIGRFAATLSAGAGYTWTVPTFTAINLVQKPIFETRRLTSVGTLSASSGSFTTTTVVLNYQIVYSRMHVWTSITIINKGTATGALWENLPFTSSLQQTCGGSVGEVAATGYMGNYLLKSGVLNVAQIARYDNVSAIVDTYNWIGGGTFTI